MAVAYTKGFLISAFLSRYITLEPKSFEGLADMAVNFYDEVGRDKFREYCSLTAEALRLYKEQLVEKKF